MNQDRIWDFYQNRLPERFTSAAGRLRHLANLARRHRRGGRVLNIGIGAGSFERMAIARGLDVYALDPIPESVDQLRRDLELGEKARIGRISALPFDDGFFDAVVVSEVIEHLSREDITSGLREIARVLAPGGRLIGTVPAREHLEDELVICPDCGKIFHRWGHAQSFTPDDIRTLLAPPFIIHKIQERPFTTWRAPSWRGGLLTYLKWGLWLAGIHCSGESILFVAEKPTAT